jgi:hypothetical protein
MNFTASIEPLLSMSRLAGLVGLGPAEVPQQRVGEGRRVAEGVAERLAVRVALLLERRRTLRSSS